MRISHIQSQVQQFDEAEKLVKESGVLTHFLHFKFSVINILEIVSIVFPPDPLDAITINTSDGMTHIVNDWDDKEGLYKFLGRE